MKMKTARIVSLLLVLALSISAISITVFAEYVSDFSNPPLYLEQIADEDAGTVTVFVKANSAFTYVGGKVTLEYDKEAFSLTSAKITGAEGLNVTKNLNAQDGATLTLTTDEDVEFVQNENFLTFVFTKAANIASGDYSFVLDVEEWTNSSFSVDTFTESKTNTVTYSVSDEKALSIGTTMNGESVLKDETIQFDVGVNRVFNCTEMIITYDSSLVEYDSENTVLTGKATVTDLGDGQLVLIDYGAEKQAGYTYALKFTAKAAGNATFRISAAKFGTDETAALADAEAVDTSELPENTGIEIKQGYSVTLDQIFQSSGGTTIEPGTDYTFSIESTTGNYYENYQVTSVTMGGNAIDLNNSALFAYDEESETWTVKNVTGDLVITGSREAKKYGLTFTGDGANDVASKPEEIPYGTNYEITLPVVEGYTFGISAVRGTDTPVGSYNEATGKYVIPGTEITGEITVTVTKAEIVPEQVEITISGSADVSFENHSGNTWIVDENTNVTLVLNAQFGYTYSLQVGSGVTEYFTDGKYTFTATEDVTITVNKVLTEINTANVTQYVQLNGTSLWLVKIGSEQMINGAEQYAYTYTLAGEEAQAVTMSWSSKYTAYVALIQAMSEPVVAAYGLAKVENIETIAYSNDVNGSGNVDVNDAQLIWNMYNNETTYTGVDNTVTLAKFWNADVSGNGKIDVADSAAIVTIILNNYKTE